MKLETDTNKRTIIENKLHSILTHLDNIEAKKAENLVDWFVEKSKYYNKIENNKLFQRHPDDMQRGDIVLVQFGMNIFPELSDDDTGKHFAMIWARQGLNFIVIPLTKHFYNSRLVVDLGIIPNMPNGINTYAKIDAIRSVSMNRIFRIQGFQNGKITTSNEIQNKISNLFLKEFINFDKFLIDKSQLIGYNETIN